MTESTQNKNRQMARLSFKIPVQPERNETIAFSEHILMVWKRHPDTGIISWWLKVIDYKKGYWAEAELPVKILEYRILD